VNGGTGRDSNNCRSPTIACRTITHAISVSSSGDSILVAAATYKENITIGKSLTIVGSGASTTIIDGGGVATVVTISTATARVSLSNFTIRHGVAQFGGGVSNQGILLINKTLISGNVALCSRHECGGFGGGIFNFGNLILDNSTVSGNDAAIFSSGGGIANSGTATVNNSTISLNFAQYRGGGIETLGGGNLSINSTTISGNSIESCCYGGGIDTSVGSVKLRNSIVANNSPSGGNCFDNGSITSKGYNLSSDRTCDFNGPGDMNNTNPLLGTLGNNGGPTQTIPLLSGSPAIDAGNPSGCTDGSGHVLKTDQRGMPRPDKEDASGCDIGAYERQSD
jgi:hypothetical protein